MLVGLQLRDTGRAGLMARVTGVPGSAWLSAFLAEADLRVCLEAEDGALLDTRFDAGCCWLDGPAAWIHVPLDARAFETVSDLMTRRFRVRCEVADPSWNSPDQAPTRRR